MDFRLLGSAVLVAATLLACSSGYTVPGNAYPGAGGANGSPGGGGGASGSGSSGGYSSGGSSGGSSSGSGTTTGSGTSSSGGTSGGSTSGGNPNQLQGVLAFPVASAGQFLPLDTATDGGPAQMEFDLSSFVLTCIGADGGGASQTGLTLALTLYSGSPTVPVLAGPTYIVFPPPGPGIRYAAVTLLQTDGTVIANGQSGPVTWAPSFSGAPSGTLEVVMMNTVGGAQSTLSGNFVAPFCGNF